MKTGRPYCIFRLVLLELLTSIPWLLIGGLVINVMPTFGVIALLMGIVGLVIALGIWIGKWWAWRLAFISSMIGVVISIGAILGSPINFIICIAIIMIELLIVRYLFNPDVKAFFGRGSSP